MKKLLLHLLLFSSIAAQAQQPVLFQDRQRLTFVLRSSDGNSETRAVFQALAEGQNRPANSIELNISFDQLLRVVRNSRTQVTASFEGKEFSVDGDVFYKGFDVRTALIPDELAAVTTLRVTGSDLAPVVSNITARIRNGETGRIEKQHADSSHQSWKLEASGHQLTYTREALTLLRGRVTLVNEYFAASAELDPLHARLQTVDPRDIEHMPLQHEKLVDIEAALARIDARDFENKLGLPTNDPLRFIPRMDALRAEMLSRRVALDETRRLLFIHLYNAGLDLQARGRKMEARRLFTNSIQENPLFAPAAYQLARMDFADGCLDDAASLGMDILERMQPDPDIRRLTVLLLQDVYDTWLDDAQRLNGQKKFRRSLDVLSKAQRLCRQAGSVRCDADLETGFRTAHAGVYNELLEEARVEVQQSRLDPAEDAVFVAMQYQKKHAAYIVSDADAQSMLHGIRQKRYDVWFSVGKTNLKQQQYDRALKAFRDADSLQVTYALVRASGADSLERTTARQVILAGIVRADAYVQDGNLGEARRQVREAAVLQDEYSLATDPVIQPKFAAIRQKIFSRECEQAQGSYDAMARRVQDAIAGKDYVGAHRQYQQADKILQDNAVCGLDDRGLRAVHDSILPASVYQQLMQEVLTLQGNGRYAEAVQRMDEAERQYYQQEISRFGIQRPTLVTYASEHFNNEFLVFLGNNLRSKKNYESSLGIYKLLTERAVSARHFNDGLYQLGVELALRDRQQQASANPKQKVLDYTSGDKRLKQLSKGYQKGWKMKG